jgi:diguanylate cyclase (GGDEF)-like protein/PAS domain S-box-containing protein
MPPKKPKASKTFLVGENKMPSSALRTALHSNTKDGDRCVLLIEADANDAAHILNELSEATDERFPAEWVTELSSGIERLRAGGIGAVALDLNLPDSHGLETFDKLLQAYPHMPILILTGPGGEQTARQAIKRGAYDYLVKTQADGHRLRQALGKMMSSPATKPILAEDEAATVTLDSMEEAVLRTDISGTVMYLNRMAEKLTGWPRKEAVGSPLADVFRIIDGTSRKSAHEALEIGPEQSTVKCTNCILVRRDGFECGIEIAVTPIHDQDGGVAGSVVAFHDVTVARANSLEMSRLAQHDPLTGLPNRVLFNDRLAQAISLASRQDKQLAVLFVDLDQFKKVNDSLGHGVGDKLLQSVADRLLNCVRRTDTVSRLGGDEFLVLLSQVEQEQDAAVSARKILRALAAPHIVENKKLDISVSIGVSTYPSDGPDAEHLLIKADTAMYEAKKEGRNNYQFFRRDMQVRIADRQMLEGDLRYALGRNEFLLHYQPKLNLQTGQITGVEALIRWAHPRRGIVSPAQFVPIAEECGLILPIGRWALLEACTQARAWMDAGLGIVPVAVNVSGVEFRDSDFISGVRAVLIATGVEPANLELELTESVLMEDTGTAIRVLDALKYMGVQLAIDDFGTGFSSFTYLRCFPVNTLKLDQSFVKDIDEDPSDATIVSAMINIGNSLNKRVVAEGIETHAQLKFLQHHECGEGQGYYFSRPVAAEQVEKLLKVGIIREAVAVA